jgi:AcrR family transcriptional regulator
VPSAEATTRDRVLDAALACVARFGIGKTTLDDVAREARCSRATVYRCFAGKDALFQATAAREWQRTHDHVVAAAGARETLEDALVAAVAAFTAEYERHDALRFVLAHEPEIVLPLVSFDACHIVFDAGAALVAAVAARFLDRDDASRLGEWLTRLVVSCLMSPSDAFALSDPVAIRRLVADFVLPSVDAESNVSLRG